MKADINVPIPVLRRMPSYLFFCKDFTKAGREVRVFYPDS